jgi:hypothetical protein
MATGRADLLEPRDGLGWLSGAPVDAVVADLACAQRQPGYTRGLHPVNVWALGGNALFIGLHWLQTRLWYDGLAQDVHEVTSFASVAVMLVVILIMENHRRGLFFGRKVSLVSAAGEVARKYHGYYFAWAIVYTFWYHPMENTLGAPDGLFLHVPAAPAGQPVFHPRAPEPLLDAGPRDAGDRARGAGRHDEQHALGEFRHRTARACS